MRTRPGSALITRVAALVAVAVAACVATPRTDAAAGAAALPRMQIDPSSVTVSGVSSGGYMATQLQLSHSALVRGAGVFAAGPWYCARGSLRHALAECFERADSQPDAPTLAAEARRAGTERRIDDPAQLARHRVWVFHGTRDDRVARPVSDALVAFYRAFVPAAQLAYVTDIRAAHGVPTVAAGVACDVAAAPYLNACGYDGVGRMLEFLYGPLVPPRAGAVARLVEFDQRPFDPAGSLAARGYLLLPSACARGARCRLHVALHGCRQGAEFVGETFARDAGYARWAEANQIVVVLPQARRSGFLPFNPQGCWDWWGYEDAQYATRAGTQVQALRAIVRGVSGL